MNRLDSEGTGVGPKATGDTVCSTSPVSRIGLVGVEEAGP